MFSINYLYSIIDKYSPILDKMARAGAKFDKSVSRIQTGLGRMEDKFKSAGAKMANLQTGLASLGAGVFLKSTIDEAKQFQQALNLTKAVTKANSEQMDIMRAKALEWGASTQFSSLQVAGAMAELGKMGNDTNQILDLMPGTMALAAAGEISMAEAANYTMATINQMGLELSDAGMVADVFATGASNAATTVSGLASAFTNTGLQAKLSGLSVTDTTQALMALASANLEGAMGGTMMMNALKDLEKMSGKTRDGFDALGIDIDNFRDATTGQMTDFWGLIEAMKAANVTGKDLGAMFDIRGKKAMSVLIETTTEKMDGFAESLRDTTGASKEMQDTLLEGLQPFVEFESVTQNLKVIMGTFVMEALSPLLNKFNEWLGNMQKNNPETLKWITYLLMGVTALGAVLIPLGLFISALGSLFGALKLALGITKIFGLAQALLAGVMGTSGASIAITTASTKAYVIGTKIAAVATKVWSVVQIAFNAVMSANPIALVIIGIAALVAIIILAVKYWKQITAAVKAAWEWIVNFYDAMKGLIVIFAPFLIPLLTTIEVIRELVKSFADIKAAFTDEGFIAGILSIGQAIFKGLIEPFKGVLDLVIAVKDKIGGAFVAVKDFFTGGEEPGSYTGNPSGRMRQQEAPTPGDGRRGANATANATLSVYTEKGMGVKPYEASGDLGYNMSNNYSRGM